MLAVMSNQHCRFSPDIPLTSALNTVQILTTDTSSTPTKCHQHWASVSATFTDNIGKKHVI